MRYLLLFEGYEAEEAEAQVRKFFSRFLGSVNASPSLESLKNEVKEIYYEFSRNGNAKETLSKVEAIEPKIKKNWDFNDAPKLDYFDKQEFPNGLDSPESEIRKLQSALEKFSKFPAPYRPPSSPSPSQEVPVLTHNKVLGPYSPLTPSQDKSKLLPAVKQISSMSSSFDPDDKIARELKKLGLVIQISPSIPSLYQRRDGKPVDELGETIEEIGAIPFLEEFPKFGQLDKESQSELIRKMGLLVRAFEQGSRRTSQQNRVISDDEYVEEVYGPEFSSIYRDPTSLVKDLTAAMNNAAKK